MTLFDLPSDTPRRSFLSRLGAGLGVFGLGGVTAAPQAAGWQAERHPEDDWFDALPGKHRFFFDSTTAEGAGSAITFASNYYAANRAYKLEPKDLAVVICLRHWSTPFAWKDPIWAKYGEVLAERIKFMDPKTGKAPTKNVYLYGDYGQQLPNRGTTLDNMIGRGMHFAVCDMATNAYAGMIASATGSARDGVYAELKANSIANCHYVPAGIVAVNRAQERGYSLVQMP